MEETEESAPFTLPTGTISMSQVATELGISANDLSLNDSRVRSLAGKPSSGPISFSDLRGKSAYEYIVFNGRQSSYREIGFRRSSFGTLIEESDNWRIQSCYSQPGNFDKFRFKVTNVASNLLNKTYRLKIIGTDGTVKYSNNFKLTRAIYEIDLTSSGVSSLLYGNGIRVVLEPV